MRGCHSGHGFLEVMAMKEKFLQEVLYLWTEHRGKFLGTVLVVLSGLCNFCFIHLPILLQDKGYDSMSMASSMSRFSF